MSMYMHILHLVPRAHFLSKFSLLLISSERFVFLDGEKSSRGERANRKYFSFLSVLK